MHFENCCLKSFVQLISLVMLSSDFLILNCCILYKVKCSMLVCFGYDSKAIKQCDELRIFVSYGLCCDSSRIIYSAVVIMFLT